MLIRTFYAGFLNQLAVFREFRLKVIVKLLRRAAGDGGAARRVSLLNVGHLQYRRELLVQPFDDRPRGACRRADRRPGVALITGDSGFGDRRQIR